MPFPVALALGAAGSVLGKIFGNRSRERASRADLANQQAALAYRAALTKRQLDEDENRRTLRGSLFKGWSNAQGLGNLIPSSYGSFSTTNREAPAAPKLQYGGTGQSVMGDIFSGAGSALISKHLQDSYEDVYDNAPRFTPASDAAQAGGEFGPPAPTVENPYATGQVQIGSGFNPIAGDMTDQEER